MEKEENERQGQRNGGQTRCERESELLRTDIFYVASDSAAYHVEDQPGIEGRPLDLDRYNDSCQERPE